MLFSLLLGIPLSLLSVPKTNGINSEVFRNGGKRVVSGGVGENKSEGLVEQRPFVMTAVRTYVYMMFALIFVQRHPVVIQEQAPPLSPNLGGSY